MSTQDILAELPHLSVAERELVARVLHDLTKSQQASESKRQAGLHAGAWHVAEDFELPLAETFWLGEDT